MDNVRIQSVREVTDNTDPNGPAEIVTLTFKSVDYTFQPVLPNGQRSGPSVSYSATFK
jgi:hypothetical protein